MIKIHIVDDERSFVKALKYNLTQAGYETITAYDGKQAIERAVTEKPDLVILDVMLPEQDGWDVCRLIRQSSRVPIIMLTAKSDESDKIVGLELGAEITLQHPLVSENLWLE